MKCLKMMNNWHQLQVIFVCFMLGCGTWAGNPPTDDDETSVVLEFQGTDSSINLVSKSVEVKDSEGAIIGNLVLTQARLVLREIKLIQDSNDGENTFFGPYVVNLIANTASPSLQSIVIPADQYSSIRLNLHKLDPEEVTDLSSDDPIIDNSIHLVGAYQPLQGSSKTFSMTFDFGEEFEIFSEDGIPLDLTESRLYSVVMSFDLNTWFDFSNFVEDFSDIESASIILDENSEGIDSAVRNNVKENIKSSADFNKRD